MQEKRYCGLSIEEASKLLAQYGSRARIIQDPNEPGKYCVIVDSN